MKLSSYGMPPTLAALLLLVLCGCSNYQPESKVKAEKSTIAYAALPVRACTPDPSWFANPLLPVEIAQGESFCDFYKFSLQSFVYFLSKNKDTSKWNFEDTDKFPVYNYANTGASCRENLATLSVSINQAYGEEVIYDQNENVVYYSVHFTHGLCNAPQIGNLPDGTIELKMAWRALTGADDKNRYVNITKDIVVTSEKGKPKTLHNITLGLAGLHIIQSTANHPEMMWGSYEHVDNNPLCHPIENIKNYSFTSKSCWKSLKDDDVTDPACKFNQAENLTALKHKSSEICRVFADGSDKANILYYEDSEGEKYSPDKYGQNVDAINQLNEAMATGNYFNSEPALKNYYIVGGLWESEPKKPSSDKDNQRGSLEMSNTLMETSIQGEDIPAGNSMLNCFGCHGYIPDKTAETRLSHIFANLHQDTDKAHSFSGHK